VTPPELPLSLYVHLPWCLRKCPYCDFNSHAAPAAGLPEARYLAALLDDLEYAATACAGRELVSIFFGGGTPSLFSAGSIAAVVDAARRLLPPAAGLEVTLEANPGAVERGRFAEYRDAGITRVSLGAQSFDPALLARLGRIHSPAETELAVAELGVAGYASFNIDLMYGLPGQDRAGALADVERAIGLGAPHVSHYQLTLEPGTVFHERPPPLPDDEVCLAMQLDCQAALADAGLVQYEVSAYAREGTRCRHNLNYWSFGDYLGIGAGAHGKLTDPVSGRVERTERVRQPVQYWQATAREGRIASRHVVAPGSLPFEFCLNALRLVEGFTERGFESRTALPIATLRPELERQRARGLIERDGAGRWRPTALGRRFLNDLQAAFLP